MARIAVLVVCFLALCSTQARAWVLVCEPAIDATMVDKVDSATAFPGMIFRFKITITARIDGILVPKDTIGYGVVREAEAASNHDRNGSLVLEMRELVFGKQIVPVVADPRDASLWAPGETLAERASGYLPVPGLVRTAVNEVRDGRNIVIGPGFNFHIVGFGDPRNTAPCHKVGQ
jgi:hypothetical protein